ncbi:MAG: hypothetical protein MI810_08315 [Flavobacteriales bacterium]|nr:hypothetical protein [Flavobacteriales bacterium]
MAKRIIATTLMERKKSARIVSFPTDHFSSSTNRLNKNIENNTFNMVDVNMANPKPKIIKTGVSSNPKGRKMIKAIVTNVQVSKFENSSL